MDELIPNPPSTFYRKLDIACVEFRTNRDLSWLEKEFQTVIQELRADVTTKCTLDIAQLEVASRLLGATVNIGRGLAECKQRFETRRCLGIDTPVNEWLSISGFIAKLSSSNDPLALELLSLYREEYVELKEQCVEALSEIENALENLRKA